MASPYTWHQLAENYGPETFPDLLTAEIQTGRLDEKQLAIGLFITWTQTRWPSQRIAASTWIDMFDLAIGSRHYLYDDAMVIPKSELPPALTVYRGANLENALGFAWTTCLDVASNFAHALDDRSDYQSGNIYKLIVHPERVLARFFNRNEFEVVVNTTGLSVSDLEVYENNLK